MHLQKPTLKKPKELFFANALNKNKKDSMLFLVGHAKESYVHFFLIKKRTKKIKTADNFTKILSFTLAQK